MSSVTRVTQATVWEDCGLFLMARVLGNAGTLITQATIASVALTVTDLTDGAETLSSTPAVNDVVFDTPQTADPRWSAALGYNLAVAVAGTAFPTGGRRYRVEIVLTPVLGSPLAVVYEVKALDLLSRL